MKVTTLIIQNREDDVAVDNERETSAGKRKTVLGFINHVRSSILAKHVIHSTPFAGFGHMSVYPSFICNGAKAQAFQHKRLKKRVIVNRL